jgi:hypothetical protein
MAAGALQCILYRGMKTDDVKYRPPCKLGIGLVGNFPAEAAKFIASETEKWERVIKAVGMQVD